MQDMNSDSACFPKVNPQEARSKRIEWIDLAKCIGIFFMVWGHCGVPLSIDIFLHAFHMPIFFFLSGYCARKRLDVKNKLRTLLLPYFLFAVALYAFWSLLAVFCEVVPSYALSYFLESLLWNNAMLSPYAGVQWFLTCLFLCELIFFLINSIPSCFFKAGLVVAFSVLGYAYPLLFDVRLFWALDCAFTALSFYAMGYLIRYLEKKRQALPPRALFKWQGTLFAVAVPIAVLATKKNGYVNMRTLEYGNYALYYLSACTIIALICLGCSWIARISVLKKTRIYKGILYIGKNTLIVLLMNQLYIQIFRFWIEPLVQPRLTVSADFLHFLQAVLTCIVMLPTIWLFHRYLPYALGKKIKKESV